MTVGGMPNGPLSVSPQAGNAFRVHRKSFPSAEGLPSSSMPLGVTGFRYSDLFAPERLKDLYDLFCTELAQKSPDAWRQYEAYRACQGEGMKPDEVSNAILATAPFVSEFIARLFNVEKEVTELKSEVKDRTP